MRGEIFTGGEIRRARLDRGSVIKPGDFEIQNIYLNRWEASTTLFTGQRLLSKLFLSPPTICDSFYFLFINKGERFSVVPIPITCFDVSY